MRFKEGDHVKIIEREATSADAKSGTFYPYFRGLAGTVDRIYDKEICVKVDPETLPEDVLKRHLEVQESIRRKWLNGLSNEARNRLTPGEKRFELAYTILIQSSDLEKIKPGDAPRPAAIKKLQPLNAPQPAAAPSPAVSEGARTPQTAVKARKAESGRAAVAEPTAKTPAKKSPKAEPPKPTGKALEKPAKAPPKAVAKPAKTEPKATTKVTAKPAAPPKGAKTPASKKGEVKPSPDRPLTSKDLEAAELAHLKQRERELKGKT